MEALAAVLASHVGCSSAAAGTGSGVELLRAALAAWPRLCPDDRLAVVDAIAAHAWQPAVADAVLAAGWLPLLLALRAADSDVDADTDTSSDGGDGGDSAGDDTGEWEDVAAAASDAVAALQGTVDAIAVTVGAATGGAPAAGAAADSVASSAAAPAAVGEAAGGTGAAIVTLRRLAAARCRFALWRPLAVIASTNSSAAFSADSVAPSCIGGLLVWARPAAGGCAGELQLLLDRTAATTFIESFVHVSTVDVVAAGVAIDAALACDAASARASLHAFCDVGSGVPAAGMSAGCVADCDASNSLVLPLVSGSAMAGVWDAAAAAVRRATTRIVDDMPAANVVSAGRCPTAITAAADGPDIAPYVRDGVAALLRGLRSNTSGSDADAPLRVVFLGAGLGVAPAVLAACWQGDASGASAGRDAPAAPRLHMYIVDVAAAPLHLSGCLVAATTGARVTVEQAGSGDGAVLDGHTDSITWQLRHRDAAAFVRELAAEGPVAAAGATGAAAPPPIDAVFVDVYSAGSMPEEMLQTALVTALLQCLGVGRQRGGAAAGGAVPVPQQQQQLAWWTCASGLMCVANISPTTTSNRVACLVINCGDTGGGLHGRVVAALASAAGKLSVPMVELE